MSKTLSSATEDYLKTILHLREEAPPAAVGNVSTQAIAARLEVAAPSATAMIKKLALAGLVLHTPYRGVELTPEGERVAVEVTRHHRLSESFLTQILGLEWDKAHGEAEKWEHVLSEEVEARMAALLGDPTHDPHGAPIPTVDGQLAREGGEPLSQLPAGTHALVKRVNDENAEVLRHLQSLGLVPGAHVEVLRAKPAEGVMQIRVDGREHTLGLAPARAVVAEVGDKGQGTGGKVGK